jgi:nucleotide-binding universal stress UspA family protein
MSTPNRLKILLAVDGSSHADAAAQLLRGLPLPAGSSVMALGVLSMRNYLYTPGRASLLEALDRTEAALAESGLEVRTGLRQGHPAEELIRYAEEHAPDLVVVGAQGLRATLGVMLGGVAQQLVEYGQWPVLVVRASYSGLRRVLLGTDGSRCSELAVRYLAAFPLPPAAEVRVMHVLAPELPAELIGPIEPVGVILPVQLAEQNAEEERAGRAALDHAEAVLGEAGRAAATVLARGDAATEIIHAAREGLTDLIVVGSRGLSNIRGWVLGSVSRKLVHYAPCSVLVVRGAEARAAAA